MQNEGKANTDQYYGHLTAKGFDSTDISFIKDELIDLDLINYWGTSGYFIKLTSEGEKAGKIGLVLYFNSIKEKEDLEIESIKSTIKSNKWNKRSVIINPILTILNILIAVLIALKIIGK